MANNKVVFNIVVFVSLLVTSYADEVNNPSGGSSNMRQTVQTEPSLFGLDTKIRYIRHSNHEVIFTDGKNSIQDIIRYENGNITEHVYNREFDHLFRELEEFPEKYVVTPEVMLIVDYSLFKRFNENETAIISYLVSYWSAVSTRFTSLQSPMFRMHIVEIIIAQDQQVLSYLQFNDNNMQSNTNNMVPLVSALGANGKWLYNLRHKLSLNNYDIAITMTSKILCMNIENDACVDSVFGTTHPSKVCFDDSAAQTTYKVAIVRNEGAFENINFVARQIGLLMGAKVVGDIICPQDDGSLLSKDIMSIDAPHWSNCSIENFRNLSKSADGACLRLVKPFQSIELISYLPGSVMRADDQCRKLGWQRACGTNTPSICKQLKCTNGDSDDYDDTLCFAQQSEAPDGTTCGGDKICFLSHCIKFSEG